MVVGRVAVRSASGPTATAEGPSPTEHAEELTGPWPGSTGHVVLVEVVQRRQVER